jgi:hypothetical protein
MMRPESESMRETIEIIVITAIVVWGSDNDNLLPLSLTSDSPQV